MQSHYVSTVGANLRWIDVPGSGEPVIFIHGLGCASSYEYPRIVTDASWCGRPALLIDLPGSGYSDKPHDYCYSTTEQARAIIEVLDAVGVNACYVYGHSMGGSIAIELAYRLGERVAALAVSEPNFYPGGGFFSRQIAIQSENQFVEKGYAALLEAEKTPWKGSLQMTAPWALWRAAKSLTEGVSPDWMAQFMMLTCRKALIVGEHSLPDADSESVANAGIPVHFINGAGHSMSWENPSALATTLSAIFR